MLLRRPRVVLAAIAGILTGCMGERVRMAPDDSADASLPPSQDPRYVLGHEVSRIDGAVERLSAYEGRVLLIVNTASKCGLTNQYAGLEALYRELGDEGFTVLAFPANDFMNQEPGTNADIAAFCTERFDVTFPLFEKITVKGEDAHPLFRDLRGLPEPLGGEPEWNFTKFLVGRDGRVIARFSPRVRPDSPEVREAVEAALRG